MSKADDKYKKMLEHQASAFNAYLEKVGAFEAVQVRIDALVDDLQAKLRGTRAELGILKGKADRLAEALDGVVQSDLCYGEAKEFAKQALKEYRGEK